MYQNLQKCDFTIIFGQEDTKVIRDNSEILPNLCPETAGNYFYFHNVMTFMTITFYHLLNHGRFIVPSKKFLW